MVRLKSNLALPVPQLLIDKHLITEKDWTLKINCDDSLRLYVDGKMMEDPSGNMRPLPRDEAATDHLKYANVTVKSALLL